MKNLLISTIIASCTTALHAQSLIESQQDFIKTKAPEKLTWENFDAVAKHASQDNQELRYHTVKWENSVINAQQVAFKADKPILMILFFGDHRVNC